MSRALFAKISEVPGALGAFTSIISTFSGVLLALNEVRGRTEMFEKVFH
jgi:hypothetical protein